MKKVWMIVIAVAVAGGGWWAVSKFRAAAAGAGNAANAATAVRVERVRRGTLIETISAPGTVQPKTKVSISARVSARIVALPFKEGDIVTKGNPTANPPVPASVLVKLDASDLDAQLKASEAHYAAQAAQITVAIARIGAEEAQLLANKVMADDAGRDLRRQNDLFESHDVSQSIIDTAQAKYDQLMAQLNSSRKTIEADQVNLEVLKHELDAAEANIAQAKDSLSYTIITSPIDGVVTRVNSEVGELVVIGTMNNAGTVIVEVADLSSMMVKVRVDEAGIAQVKAGQIAEVRAQAYPKQIFKGTVTTVALDQTEDQQEASRYFKTEVLLAPTVQRIISGLSADVDIQTAKHDDAMLVPSQCVMGRAVEELPPEIRKAKEVDSTKAQTAIVYRSINGKAVVTPVEVGASDLTHTLIVSGLTDNDMVITGPYRILDSLHHDQPIKAEEVKATPQATTQATTTQATTTQATTTQATTKPTTELGI